MCMCIFIFIFLFFFIFLLVLWASWICGLVLALIWETIIHYYFKYFFDLYSLSFFPLVYPLQACYIFCSFSTVPECPVLFIFSLCFLCFSVFKESIDISSSSDSFLSHVQSTNKPIKSILSVSVYIFLFLTFSFGFF